MDVTIHGQTLSINRSLLAYMGGGGGGRGGPQNMGEMGESWPGSSIYLNEIPWI